MPKKLLLKVVIGVAITTLSVSCGGAPATSVPVPQPTAIAATHTMPAVPTNTAAPIAIAQAVKPCSAVNEISMVQAAAPASAAPTAVPSTRDPNAPSRTPPRATATPLPAPKIDRIGYPEDYQNKFKLMYVYDRASNKQVRVICGNDVATTTTQGKPYPYGSVLVMETWRTKQDNKGNVMKDEKGHYIRESLTTIFVMKKDSNSKFETSFKEAEQTGWSIPSLRP